MKKNLLLFAAFLTLFSCKKENSFILDNKINVYQIKNNYINTTDKRIVTFFNFLTISDLNDIVNYKEDAFVFIYAPNCASTCGTFRTFFESYIYKNKILVNYSEIGLISQIEGFKNLEIVSQFILIRDGKLLNATKVDDNNSSSFIEEYFDKYINIKNTMIANDLYYDDENIKLSSSVHLLYNKKLYDDRNYILFNNIDLYLEDNLKVLFINRDKVNYKSLYSYLNENEVDSINFIKSNDYIDQKYNLNANDIESTYLSKQGDKYISYSLTISSKS